MKNKLFKYSDLTEILDLQECLGVPETGVMDDATTQVLMQYIQEADFANSEYFNEKLREENPEDPQTFLLNLAIKLILKEKYSEDMEKIMRFMSECAKDKMKKSGFEVIEMQYEPEYHGSSEYQKVFEKGGRIIHNEKGEKILFYQQGGKTVVTAKEIYDKVSASDSSMTPEKFARKFGIGKGRDLSKVNFTVFKDESGNMSFTSEDGRAYGKRFGSGLAGRVEDTVTKRDDFGRLLGSIASEKEFTPFGNSSATPASATPAVEEATFSQKEYTKPDGKVVLVEVDSKGLSKDGNKMFLNDAWYLKTPEGEWVKQTSSPAATPATETPAATGGTGTGSGSGGGSRGSLLPKPNELDSVATFQNWYNAEVDAGRITGDKLKADNKFGPKTNAAWTSSGNSYLAAIRQNPPASGETEIPITVAAPIPETPTSSPIASGGVDLSTDEGKQKALAEISKIREQLAKIAEEKKQGGLLVKKYKEGGLSPNQAKQMLTHVEKAEKAIEEGNTNLYNQSMTAISRLMEGKSAKKSAIETGTDIIKGEGSFGADEYELLGALADVGNMFVPGPAGLVLDGIGATARYKANRLRGESPWGTLAVDAALGAIGTVPLLGEAATATKVLNNSVKLIKKHSGKIAGIMTMLGVANAQELANQSKLIFEKIENEGIDSLSSEDLGTITKIAGALVSFNRNTNFAKNKNTKSNDVDTNNTNPKTDQNTTTSKTEKSNPSADDAAAKPAAPTKSTAPTTPPSDKIPDGVSAPDPVAPATPPTSLFGNMKKNIGTAWEKGKTAIGNVKGRWNEYQAARKNANFAKEIDNVFVANLSQKEKDLLANKKFMTDEQYNREMWKLMDNKIRNFQNSSKPVEKLLGDVLIYKKNELVQQGFKDLELLEKLQKEIFGKSWFKTGGTVFSKFNNGGKMNKSESPLKKKEYTNQKRRSNFAEGGSLKEKVELKLTEGFDTSSMHDDYQTLVNFFMKVRDVDEREKAKVNYLQKYPYLHEEFFREIEEQTLNKEYGAGGVIVKKYQKGIGSFQPITRDLTPRYLMGKEKISADISKQFIEEQEKAKQSRKPLISNLATQGLIDNTNSSPIYLENQQPTFFSNQQSSFFGNQQPLSTNPYNQLTLQGKTSGIEDPVIENATQQAGITQQGGVTQQGGIAQKGGINQEMNTQTSTIAQAGKVNNLLNLANIASAPKGNFKMAGMDLPDIISAKTSPVFEAQRRQLLEAGSTRPRHADPRLAAAETLARQANVNKQMGTLATNEADYLQRMEAQQQEMLNRQIDVKNKFGAATTEFQNNLEKARLEREAQLRAAGMEVAKDSLLGNAEDMTMNKEIITREVMQEFEQKNKDLINRYKEAEKKVATLLAENKSATPEYAAALKEKEQLNNEYSTLYKEAQRQAEEKLMGAYGPLAFKKSTTITPKTTAQKEAELTRQQTGLSKGGLVKKFKKGGNTNSLSATDLIKIEKVKGEDKKELEILKHKLKKELEILKEVNKNNEKVWKNAWDILKKI